MSQWRGHTYYEQAPGSPIETWATDASRVVRTLFFPERPDGLKRQKIAQDFLGYATYKVSGTKKYISRLTPHFYVSTGGTYLYATSILSSEMVGSPNIIIHGSMAPGDRIAHYPWWRVTLQYSTTPWDYLEDGNVLGSSSSTLYVSAAESYPDEGDALRRGWALTRFISKTIQPGGRVIPIRQGVFRYEGFIGDGKGIPTYEPFPYNEPWATLKYVWHQVPLSGYPANTIQRLLGSVNDTTFDGYATGTLMFTSVQLTPRRDPFGTRTFDVCYTFQWAPKVNKITNVALGHNAIPMISGGDINYVFVTSLQDGTVDIAKRPFRYRSPQDLFIPDQ